MTLKNISNDSLAEVILHCYFDGDIDGGSSNRFFRTKRSLLLGFGMAWC